jgi:hypothetical protein
VSTTETSEHREWWLDWLRGPAFCQLRCTRREDSGGLICTVIVNVGRNSFKIHAWKLKIGTTSRHNVLLVRIQALSLIIRPANESLYCMTLYRGCSAASFWQFQLQNVTNRNNTLVDSCCGQILGQNPDKILIFLQFSYYTAKEKGGKPDRKPYFLPYGLRIHTETLCLRTLKIMPSHLHEILHSWICLLYSISVSTLAG